MTSISGSMSAISPADRMQTMLQQAVSTGTVKASDQSALSSALTDIDKAMKSSGPPGQGATPASMKAKVDGLVDQEVSDGKLTSDQATELKKVFATAAQSMHGGHGGMHAKSSSSDASTDTDLTSILDTSSTSGSTSDASNALTAFLKQLAQTTSSSTNYTAGGTSASSNLSSVLVDASA